MQRTQQGKGKKGRGEGREGNKSITPRSLLPASPSHCARRPRQKFPAPPAAGRDATGFVATGCLVPSPLPDPPSNVLVASKISMSGLTDEGWCSGREREPRKQTGSAPGIAAVSISPSLLSRVCVLRLAVGCVQLFYTGRLISGELHRCPRARIFIPRSLDRWRGDEVGAFR